LLQQGGKLTTADTGKPIIYLHDRVVYNPRLKILREMIDSGLIHCCTHYNDQEWHLGGGGYILDSLCSKCFLHVCPICHSCSNDPNSITTEDAYNVLNVRYRNGNVDWKEEHKRLLTAIKQSMIPPETYASEFVLAFAIVSGNVLQERFR
jgi:hypothetical protein